VQRILILNLIPRSQLLLGGVILWREEFEKILKIGPRLEFPLPLKSLRGKTYPIIIEKLQDYLSRV